MYESFFRLKARPFSAAPVIQNYYPGEAIEQARQTCIRAIERAEGPVLVIGPSGVGKTLLCRLLAAYFESVYQVALLSNVQICTHKSLLQSILFELGLTYRDMDEGELRLHLIDHLQPSDSCPHGVLLIIDEAHTLPIRLLEEIRMLTNVVRQGQPRVRLVLAGGSRLDERFANPKLESFNQRIAARCYLQAMSRTETDDYVRSQLSFAGGAADVIFAEEAFRAVFQATDGIPRLVNQVCNHALTLACQTGNRKVDAVRVEEAWADLQQLPAPWHEKKVETDNTQAFIEFGSLDAELPSPPLVPSVDPVVSSVNHCNEVLDFLASGDVDADPSIMFGSMGPNIEAAQGFESPIYGETESACAAEEPLDEPTEPAIEPAVDPFETAFADEEIVLDRFVSAASVPADPGAPETDAGAPPCGTSGEARADSSPPAAPREILQDEASTEQPETLCETPAALSATAGDRDVDASDDAWEELLTILPTSANDADLATDAFAGMFEITVLETSDRGGLVLDTTGSAHPHALTPTAAPHNADDESRDPCVMYPTVRTPQDDDRDLIQLADDEESSTLAHSEEAPQSDARRMEYRDLFAQLRRTL